MHYPYCPSQFDRQAYPKTYCWSTVGNALFFLCIQTIVVPLLSIAERRVVPPLYLRNKKETTATIWGNNAFQFNFFIIIVLLVGKLMLFFIVIRTYASSFTFIYQQGRGHLQCLFLVLLIGQAH
jgi:hypothetical protein